ncbi:FAS-associated factor 2-B [Orchesella cincta]|uniref:FAS-associated factor 2-B n=1 Tax=Orchesella cincta TaxID=48709 RepID=A0A1D2N5A1_ORCCI|nr:FAS-associated factor 2-B [Orchesella cincta]
MMGAGNGKPSVSQPSPNRPITRAYRRMLSQELEPQGGGQQREENGDRKRPTEDGRGDSDRPKPIKKGKYDEKNEEEVIIDDDSEYSDSEYSDAESPINQRRPAPRETPSTTRSIVAEQNHAYNESLRADKEKERVKQEKAKEKEALNDAKEKILRLKKEAEESLPVEGSTGEEGVFPLVLRLPTGKSVRRNFRATDSIHTLRQFAFSQDATPVRFEIVKYPNEVLPVGKNGDGSTLTLKDVGITKREALHVRMQERD